MYSACKCHFERPDREGGMLGVFWCFFGGHLSYLAIWMGCGSRAIFGFFHPLWKRKHRSPEDFWKSSLGHHFFFSNLSFIFWLLEPFTQGQQVHRWSWLGQISSFATPNLHDSPKICRGHRQAPLRFHRGLTEVSERFAEVSL